MASNIVFNFAIALPLFMLGLVLVWRGWRGRLVNDHPYCRACGFDLTGLSKIREQCPECGSNLLNLGAVREGLRVRRYGLLIAGLLCLLVPLLPLGMTALSQVTQVNIQHYKPVWLLRAEAMRGSTSASKAALEEITRRLGNSSIIQLAEVTTLIDETLRRQVNLNQAWEPAWGEVVEVTNGMGLLDQIRWEQYLQQAVQHSVTLIVRPQVRVGDPIPYRVQLSGARSGSKTRYWLEVKSEQPKISNLAIRGRGSMTHSSTLCTTSSGNSSSTQHLSPDEWQQLGPAPLTVPVHLEVRFTLQESYGKATLLQFTHTLSATLQVVPADQPTARAVHDPAHAVAMEKAIHSVELEEKANGELSAVIKLDRPPVGVAYQVVAHVADQPFKLGSITVKPGGQTHYHVSGDVKLGTADKVDVELVPSVDVAVATVDVLEYWGEPMIFKDVPVKRLKPTATPP